MGTKLLDCTLREGTHLNDGNFGEDTIKTTIERLSSTGIEIVEIGFLDDEEDSNGTSHFNSVASADDLLGQCDIDADTEFALMVRPDRFDVSSLEGPPDNCTIVRIAFYQKDTSVALDSARTLQSKGFDVFLNPIATSTYDNSDVKQLATGVNDVNPRGVNIVDTFGALSRERAIEVYDTLDATIDSGITIGVHLHQNLSLSRAIAQDIVERRPESRDLVVDGSLYGMGRSPGNLHIELIAEFLNETGRGEYRSDPLFDIIDQEIKPMKREYDWGYSPEYFVSAKHNVHRTYAERMKRDGASLSDIEELCQSISGGPNAVQYDGQLVEQYYEK